MLLTAASPKFAAQAIRKVYDIGWKPTHFLASISVSVKAVMQPAGPEKAIGIISAGFSKSPLIRNGGTPSSTKNGWPG